MLRIKHLSKTYSKAERPILSDLSFSLDVGETLAVCGASGCGKSTLLHLAGLLETPDEGEIWIQGENASHASESRRTSIRREKLGFIYQFHHLLPEYNAIENVMMPLRIQGKRVKQAKLPAEALLERLGLPDRMKHMPSQLSGGEKQRIAIARALVHQPALVLADEPTGNLDPGTAKHVMELFLEAVASLDTSLLMVTHDAQLASQLDDVLHLESHVEIAHAHETA